MRIRRGCCAEQAGGGGGDGGLARGAYQRIAVQAQRYGQLTPLRLAGGAIGCAKAIGGQGAQTVRRDIQPWRKQNQIGRAVHIFAERLQILPRGSAYPHAYSLVSLGIGGGLCAHPGRGV